MSRRVWHVVVMGVSGCGKSTFGEALARELGWRFVEGDSFHPAKNVEKMSAGIPLDDQDRLPWLEGLAAEIGKDAAKGLSSILGCSALKRAYRDILRTGSADVFFIHLHGDPELLAARVGHRPGHFFPRTLFKSQLDTLEPLAADEAGAVIDIGLSAADQIRAALDVLGCRD